MAEHGPERPLAGRTDKELLALSDLFRARIFIHAAEKQGLESALGDVEAELDARREGDTAKGADCNG